MLEFPASYCHLTRGIVQVIFQMYHDIKITSSCTIFQWCTFICTMVQMFSWIFDGRLVKGCGLGPWLVLVSPFRENWVATCKIGSFLCSLDNLLQKNVILFSGNKISKWCLFEKRAIFDQLFTFFSHQGKVTKIPSGHISLTYTYFAHHIDFFLPYQFWKKYEFIRYGFSLVWVLVVIQDYSGHFGTINK